MSTAWKVPLYAACAPGGGRGAAGQQQRQQQQQVRRQGGAGGGSSARRWSTTGRCGRAGWRLATRAPTAPMEAAVVTAEDSPAAASSPQPSSAEKSGT